MSRLQGFSGKRGAASERAGLLKVIARGFRDANVKESVSLTFNPDFHVVWYVFNCSIS
jgi:hypothetical protein